MKRNWIFLLLLVLGGIPLEGKNSSKSNQEKEKTTNQWANVYINSSLQPATNSRILIVTCRQFTPNHEEKKFFNNKFGKKISIVLADYSNNIWHLDTIPSLQEGLSLLNDGGNFLYFIHGNSKTFPDVLYRSHLLKKRYNINIVAFDWPSEQKKLDNPIKLAKKALDEFEFTLMEFQAYRKANFKKNQRLSLLMHSLGNYFYFTLLDKERKKKQRPLRIFDNVIFNSAAINQKKHARTIATIPATTNVFITSNENDFVLKSVSIVTFSTQVGNKVKSTTAPNANYIDFTRWANNEHTYFLGLHEFENRTPNYKNFYKTILNGKTVDLTNTQQFEPKEQGVGYYIK